MSQSNGASVLWSGSIASDPEIDQLPHPSRFYARSADVAADQLLTVEERRANLSSWASDACAVDSNPALRRPPHANGPVTFDEHRCVANLILRAVATAPRPPSQWVRTR
jgi:hypothetical protein